MGGDSLIRRASELMLIACVILYMAATIAVGVYASSRVKDSKEDWSTRLNLGFL